MKLLTKVGQIKKGDCLMVEYDGKTLPYIARNVIHKGTLQEEIIVHRKLNKYFIVALAIDGSSWAKKVEIHGEMFDNT